MRQAVIRIQCLERAFGEIESAGTTVGSEPQDTRLGLQDLARVSGQKMRSFSLAFRERTGFAPYAYVLKRRVETAWDMIRATDLPIIEIAYTCGFSSQAHMTSTFKQKLGVTPGRIRQNR